MTAIQNPTRQVNLNNYIEGLHKDLHVCTMYTQDVIHTAGLLEVMLYVTAKIFFSNNSFIHACILLYLHVVYELCQSMTK